MVCLDTDILVSATRRDPEALAFLSKLGEELEPTRTTIITSCELYHGAFKTKNPKNRQIVDEALRSLEVLQLAPESAQIFGRLCATLQTEGKTVADFDLLIASICIANNEVLVTRNCKHFEKIGELKTKKW